MNRRLTSLTGGQTVTPDQGEPRMGLRYRSQGQKAQQHGDPST
jgi:hypothetical protein